MIVILLIIYYICLPNKLNYIMTNIDYLLKFDKDESIEVSLQDIYKETFYFGFITYGGPLAHIGLFRKKFVEDLNWIDDK